MRFSFWTEKLRQRMAGWSRRRRACGSDAYVRSNGRGRPSYAEQCEDRLLPTVSALLFTDPFNPALQDLTILCDSADDVSITVNGGNVQILVGTNGGPQTTLLGQPTVAPSALARIDLFGSDDTNFIDLNGLTTANGFSAAIVVNVEAGDSDDFVDAFSSDIAVSLVGGNGGDVLLGGDANDTINGGDGADLIFGGFGADTLNGGNGADILLGDEGGDSIQGSDGADLVDAGAGNDTVDGGNGDDAILGADGDDLLNAGSGNDLIGGEAGLDSIFGGTGNDELFGGDGNDVISGNDGADSVLGQSGDDSITGNQGDDLIFGDDGNDVLSGDAGNDTLVGDDGNDLEFGGADSDSLLGSLGDDTLQGQSGNDTLEGHQGADLLDGGAGNDLLKSDVEAFKISGPITVVEGNNGTTTATFAVTLSAPMATSVSVGYFTLDGTATNGSDYAATSGTLQFAPGEQTKTVSVTVFGDLIQESNEDFFVILDNPIGASIQQNQAQGVIQDDGDTLVSMSIDNITVVEGNVGTSNATFTVTLSSASQSSISVDYTTQNGTALSGSDYQTRAGTLMFPAGTTQAAITVPIVGDVILEPTPTETFSVLLTNLTGNAVFAANGNQGTATILDNEVPPPSVSINDVSVTEGNTSTKVATFTISLSATSTQTVTVNYTIANGTATAGVDYRLPSTFTGFRDPAIDSDGDRLGDGYVTIGAKPDKVAVGDTDGDGNLDLLSTRKNLPGSVGTGQSLALLRGDGTGQFEDAPGRILNSSAGSIDLPTLVDVDDDGRIDALGTGSSSSGDLHVFRNLSSGFVYGATGSDFVTGSAEYALGDFTGDGLPDIAVVTSTGQTSSTSLSVARNNGNGTFSQISTLTVSNQSLFDASSMDAGDINADGFVDLVVATSDGQLRTYTGNGTGTLAVGAVISNSTFYQDLKLVDLDGDNDLDVVLLSQNTNEVASRLNTNGGFGALQRFAVGTTPIALDVGDVNRDGRQDVVTANRGSDNVSFLAGNGDGSFAARQNFAAGASGDSEISPSDVVLADVNNDQLLDVVVGHNDSYSSYVTVLLAQGTQQASGQITIPAGSTSATLNITIVGDGTIESDENFLVNLTSATNATIADGQGIGRIVNDDSTGGITTSGFTSASSALSSTVANAAVGSAPATSGTSTTASSLSVVGDTLLGSSGNDTLLGSVYDDLLNGGAGNDSLNGVDGNDTIYGGAGNDTISGGDGNDTLNGQGGNDVLDGGVGDDQLVWTGASGASDTVAGSTGFDTGVVNGTGSADTFAVGQDASGQMTVTDSGATLTIQSTITNVVINGNAGDDVVTIGSLNNVTGTVLTINGGDGNDNLDATGAVLGFVRMGLNGQAGDDSLTGSDGTDTLDGGDGNDTLAAGVGNDSVIGGAGDDVLSGQDGNDTLNGSEGDDFATGGNGNDNVLGGDGNDTLQGSAGNDTLNGQAGDDSLVDTTGNDSLVGDTGFDTLDSGDGNDTLDGGFGDDSLTAGAGTDKLRGGDGNDTLDAGDGDDELNAGDGDDQLIGGAGNDGLAGGDGDDLINGGAGNDVITGNDGNDSLLGGSGADTLLGGDGDDSINGQGGADILAGNEGVDTLTADASDSVNEAFVLSQTLLDKLDGV